MDAYTRGDFYEEVKRARQEYCARTGEIAEGSEKFEIRMTAFLDWYLFDRPMDQAQLAPVKLFVLEKLDTVAADERSIFEDLAKSNHSLFELLKAKGDDIYVKDLFTNEKFIVEDDAINRGFTKGDVFEARLIKYKDRLVFGSSFVFHPAEARPFLLKQIKLVRFLDEKKRLALLHRLASMRLKMEQYAHIDVHHIYTENPIF
mgnify:CR=1 FL=1